MRKIALFGRGKTTRAVANRLKGCDFFDDRFKTPSRDEEGRALLPPDGFDPARYPLQIPSPGFPPAHPLIKKASNLISEYDLFLSPVGQQEGQISQPLPYTVWVSGTNGKTTTTQMITHLLSKRGAVSGGNIGTPLAELDPRAPIWVLETSSFTLHYTRYAKPDLYVLLPLSPDHLDWHGGWEGYVHDKLKPLHLMREGEAILLPNNLADTPTKGFKIPYGNADDLARYFGIQTDKIRFQGAFLLDALLALGVSKILFDEIDYDAVNAFVLDPHRQEPLRDAKGRLWINDTKATNPDATIQALKPYADRPIHLILGGEDKGVDLSALFEALKGYEITLYAVGKNARRIEGLANEHNIPCRYCETLDRAVSAIDRDHTLQSVALLSPAAASLDQFANYAERGNLFKELVRNL